MLAAISDELEARRGFIPDREVATIYIGGGTPSLLDPQELQQLIDRVKELWDCTALEEVTVEMNPDDLDSGYLERLTQTDIDRLSIGIQSFIDRDLRFMGRRHNSQKAIEAVRAAQKVGFGNISIDLIYGIPGMTMQEWRGNLEQAFSLGVQHLSAYHLSIEPNTPFGRRNMSPVDEAQSEEQFMLLHEMAAEAGFEHYEISNFALPGLRAKHNSAYWSGSNYLGVGPSAHSYNGRQRSWSASDADVYLNGGDIYQTETLTEQDRYNEFLMLALRRAEGVDPTDIARIFGREQRDKFLRDAAESVAKRAINVVSGRYFIPFEKILISDHIISSLLSL